MGNKEIAIAIKRLYSEKESLIRNINTDINNKILELQNLCTHKDESDNYTIEYDSIYEMRSRDMHCTQCDKSGSREDLTNR